MAEENDLSVFYKLQKIREETTKLLQDLVNGMFPDELTEEQIEIMKTQFGENWFEELNYKSKEIKKPEGRGKKYIR